MCICIAAPSISSGGRLRLPSAPPWAFAGALETPRTHRLLDSPEVLDGHIAPQTFQVVIGPLVLGEDVDHDVPEIEQHPAPAAGALAADRPLAGLAQGLFDPVRDRLELPLVGTRA